MNSDLLARPILNATDLHRYWEELMSPLGFPERRVYFVFLDPERRAVRQLHEIDGMPLHPSAADADALMTVLGHFSDEFAIAILLARPGQNPMDHNDRAWAQSLAEAGRRHRVSLEPLHLATDRELVPFAGDDLVV